MPVLLAALALAAFALGAGFAVANDDLLAAARERPVARVKAALSAGADPNAQRTVGRHAAARGGLL